jgi:hypothetical protein
VIYGIDMIDGMLKNLKNHINPINHSSDNHFEASPSKGSATRVIVIPQGVA